MAMLLFCVFDLSAHAMDQTQSGAVCSYPLAIRLQSVWQQQFTPSLSFDSIAQNGWKDVSIPAREAKASTHFAAYRKTFASPLKNRDDRIVIHFDGIAFASQVYLNGRFVGGHGPTLEPHTFDLTPFIEDSNELIVLVQDWTSTIEGPWVPNSAEQKRGQNHVTNEYSVESPFDESLWRKTIAPLGTDDGLFGLWDDVWLEVLPAVFVEDAFVESLVAEGRIRVTGQVRNMTSREWSGKVTAAVEEGRLRKEIDVGPLAAGQRQMFSVVLNAKGLIPWEPNRPALYRMHIETDGGRFRVSFPFGYRQIEHRRHELFLNGKKIHLFTASIGPGMTRTAFSEHLCNLKSLNINAVRFHGNIFPGWYYEAADRLGMMVVAESALYGSGVTQFDYGSDIFFKNAAIHWRGLVRKFRNHPSVVVYSIENECVEYSQGPRAELKFAELGRMVKKWDSTRPILFNGGDDPGGVANIVSLHYPHELPFWNRYPLDAWWLRGARRGTPIDSFWYRKPDTLWHWNRTKPLDLGEIGYPFGGEPHGEAVLLGDIAYGVPARVAQDMGRAEVWRQTVESARAHDVAMINPWNPPAGDRTNAALKEAFKPVRLILHPEAGNRYYSGARVCLRAGVVNDSREMRRVLLACRLDNAAQSSLWGREQSYSLAPGQIREIKIFFKLPEVQQAKSFPPLWLYPILERFSRSWTKPLK